MSTGSTLDIAYLAHPIISIEGDRDEIAIDNVVAKRVGQRWYRLPTIRWTKQGQDLGLRWTLTQQQCFEFPSREVQMPKGGSVSSQEAPNVKCTERCSIPI
jgi:hypothetical protein